jgi:hypothetical protein
VATLELGEVLAVALTYYPAKLPSLEPIKDAILAALQADLPEALSYVDTHGPLGTARKPLGLVEPRGYELATLASFSVVTQWPWLQIVGRDNSVEEAWEQLQNARWTGFINLFLYLQSPNDAQLARMMDRYPEAIWLVLMNNEPFAGAHIDTPTPHILPSEPAGSTPNARCVGMFFEVRYTA